VLEEAERLLAFVAADHLERHVELLPVLT